MKTRIATVLSVIGVLTAGTAAAVVNTQIFESDPVVANESAALLAPQPTTIDLATDGGQTSSTDTARSSGLLTEYSVGDAGTITIDVIGGRLRIVSVDPSPGWTVIEQEEKTDEPRVEVSLSDGTISVEFEADLVDGRIVPHLDATEITVSGSGTPTPRATLPTNDDDQYEDDDYEDDDQYEDDDYEDDDQYEDDDYEDDDRYEDHDDD